MQENRQALIVSKRNPNGSRLKSTPHLCQPDDAEGEERERGGQRCYAAACEGP